MTEPLIDLRALLVEREDFEGGMVSRLREGLAQGGPQVRNLKEIVDILQKRLAVAAAPQQKKIHLKLGIANYFLDFDHETETAEPGYYSVGLENVQAELTSTTRAAVSRYSFDENAATSTLLFEAGGSNRRIPYEVRP